jgi:hypothetical protein
MLCAESDFWHLISIPMRELALIACFKTKEEAHYHLLLSFLFMPTTS